MRNIHEKQSYVRTCGGVGEPYVCAVSVHEKQFSTLLLKDFHRHTNPAQLLIYFVPISPPPDAQQASVVKRNCRQCGSGDASSQRLWVCGCLAAPLFLIGFYILLHSKLSLRRLNSWKFHSEGVTHIFLQRRLFKRENNKGKLKAQGKLAKESWIKVECRESEGKFCVEKIIFRQVKVLFSGIFVRKL